MNVIAKPLFTWQGQSAQYVCVYVGHTLCLYVTHGFDLNDGPSDEAVVFSSRQKLAPSTTATCLRAPPTPSTSMTRPRRKRRTWSARRLICSTRLKDRSAFHNGFLLSYCEEHCWALLISVWSLFGVRYSNWWRWTATGVLCALLCIRASPWLVWKANFSCSQTELDPWRTWRLEVLLQVIR